MAIFKKRVEDFKEFGDAVASGVEEGTILELRLGADSTRFKVQSAGTYSLVGFFLIRGTSNFDGKPSVVNPDQIKSFKVVGKE